MIQINYFIDPQFSVDQSALEQTAKQLLAEYEVDDVQLDLSVVSEDKIKQLNQEYMQRGGVTDVLSFPQQALGKNQFPANSEELLHLGDIVICYPVAEKAANQSSKSVTDQLSFYLEHGLLHLLGYHH